MTSPAGCWRETRPLVIHPATFAGSLTRDRVPPNGAFEPREVRVDPFACGARDDCTFQPASFCGVEVGADPRPQLLGLDEGPLVLDPTLVQAGIVERFPNELLEVPRRIP